MGDASDLHHELNQYLARMRVALAPANRQRKNKGYVNVNGVVYPMRATPGAMSPVAAARRPGRRISFFCDPCDLHTYTLGPEERHFKQRTYAVIEEAIKQTPKRRLAWLQDMDEEYNATLRTLEALPDKEVLHFVQAAQRRIQDEIKVLLPRMRDIGGIWD